VFTFIGPLRLQYLSLALPRYVEAPPETQARPGEKITEFRDRITLEAAARGDAGLMARCRAAMKELGGDPWDQWNFGLQHMLHGLNMEMIGEYVLATDCYLCALKEGGKYAPEKVVEDRIASLRARQPAAFEEGTNLFLEDQEKQKQNSSNP
jgi:hypothetical protein